MKDSTYSIKDLENLTGIKAHTIRIWEQRYELLNPKRTETNIRYYDDTDLKKILNVNLLYNNGLKISKISKLSEDEIISEAKNLMEADDSGNLAIEELMQAILELDEQKTQEILEKNYQQKGIITFYTDLVSPSLVKIGQLWQLNSLAISNEHFYSNLLRAFILGKTNDLTPKRDKNKKILLFLHEIEDHELTLLFYQYLLKDMGYDCVYLGANTPIEDVESTYFQINPDMVLTSMITNISSKKFKHIMDQLLDFIPNNKLCISGRNVITYDNLVPSDVRTITRFNHFVEIFS